MIRFAPLTRMIKHIIIINVLVFVAVYLLPLSNVFEMTKGQLSSYLSFHFSGRGFEPIQIISHMFMHSGISPGGELSLRHLLYNMVGLYFLGTSVEQAFGEKRFLILYFVAGFVALLAHIVVGYSTGSYDAVLGASGAVSGVVVAFATLYPNRTLMLLPLPIPIKAVFLVGAYIAYDLYLGFSGASTGIAHFAHLGGALAGFILARMWKQNNYRQY